MASAQILLGAGDFDPLLGTMLFDDFFDTVLTVGAVSGVATNSINGTSATAANQMGLAIQACGAAGVDAARLVRSTNGQTLFFSGGLVLWETMHRLLAISDGTNNAILRIGMGDLAGLADNTDGVYLEYDFATNGDHNYRLCAANNGTRTKTDTGIIANTAWRHVVLMVNDAGTSVSCTIDGVAGSAPVTTNINITAARVCYPCAIQWAKQLGAGTMTIHHDFWKFRQLFSTARGV